MFVEKKSSLFQSLYNYGCFFIYVLVVAYCNFVFLAFFLFFPFLSFPFHSLINEYYKDERQC